MQTLHCSIQAVLLVKKCLTDFDFLLHALNGSVTLLQRSCVDLLHLCNFPLHIAPLTLLPPFVPAQPGQVLLSHHTLNIQAPKPPATGPIFQSCSAASGQGLCVQSEKLALKDGPAGLLVNVRS